jgi:cysteate synthase
MDASHYHLRCTFCGAEYPDSEEGFRLACDRKHGPALLEAVYAQQRLTLDDTAPGLFRYRSWLPVRRVLGKASRTVTYRSQALAKHLGLERLFIAFNGYWPERGATMTTGSFKELEAPSVLARLPENEDRSLVIASAGNTGRAFLQLASENAAKVTVVVPEFALPAMWTTVPKGENVRLVVLEDADYFDAIQLAGAIVKLDGYHDEGGAKNVARRDGMGTVLLNAVEEIGAVPEHYFQAVGSGTGGIAAWEMMKRLHADGRYGDASMRLHLAQSTPFTPMTEAWSERRRDLPEWEPEKAKRRALAVHAPVLSNRKPPYGIIGGVFDALSDTGGAMYAISHEQAQQAGALFAELEGSDLDPAAEVAVAALIEAKTKQLIDPGQTILLNITGGGHLRARRDGLPIQAKPDATITPAEFADGSFARKL